MTKIHVVKPEIGISGLDTHIIYYCLATGAYLFSGEKVHNSKLANKVFPGLIGGTLTGTELEEIADCEILYFPNGQRPRYWKIVEAIRQTNSRLMLINRCGNYIQNQDEAGIINRIFDRVVVPSFSLKKNLSEWGINERKIVLLRNIVSNDFSNFSVQKSASFKEKYKLLDKYILLYPGRYGSMSKPGEIVTYKGLLVILEAMQKLPSNVHLLIAGTDVNGHAGLDKVRNKINEILSTFSIRDRVTFIEATDCLHDNFPSAIACSDIVLHPNTEPEPFGTVILESMINKKPVIITSLAGAMEVMNIARPNCTSWEIDAVLVRKDDKNDLALKIKQLIQNPKQAKKIGQNANKTASKFTEDKLFSTYKSLFVRSDIGSVQSGFNVDKL